MLFLTAAPAHDEARFYEDRAVEAMRARGTTIDVRRFELGDADRNADQNAVIAQELTRINDGTGVLASSTVLPLVGPAFRTHARRLRLVAIAHHASNRDRRFQTIPDAALSDIDAMTLPYARRVIVPSLHTAMSIGAYGVLPDQIAMVLPAADRAPLAEGSGGLNVVSTLPFVRDAGLMHVIDAALSTPTVKLHLVGAPVDAEYARELASKASDRITVTASADTTARKSAMHTADLAVVSWHYDPHGHHILEALARGIPVCAANAGAAQQLVPKNAGLLIPPASTEAFAQAFRTFSAQPHLLALLKQNAEQARNDVRPWSRVGAEMLKEIEVACR